MSTPSLESMSQTKVYVNSLAELNQVVDRIGCIINPARESYIFPLPVTVYGFSEKEEMSFGEFKGKYLQKQKQL